MAAHPTASDAAVAVRTERLYRAYGDSWALEDVALSLPAGETLALIGSNGAGKSTLLRILASLLRATEGEVAVLGCELPREAWRLRGRIGYLGHQALLYRDLSAAENLRFHARLFGLPGDGASRIAELLERVELSHRASSRVAEMSAGMIQRLAICRAVLHEPELLLLDEPFANLDPEGVRTVEPLLAAGEGRSRVIVSHDVAGALASSNRVLALTRSGAVAYHGSSSGLDEDSARAVYSDRARARAGAA